MACCFLLPGLPFSCTVVRKDFNKSSRVLPLFMNYIILVSIGSVPFVPTLRGRIWNSRQIILRILGRSRHWNSNSNRLKLFRYCNGYYQICSLPRLSLKYCVRPVEKFVQGLWLILLNTFVALLRSPRPDILVSILCWFRDRYCQSRSTFCTQFQFPTLFGINWRALIQSACLYFYMYIIFSGITPNFPIVRHAYDPLCWPLYFLWHA